LDTWILAPEWYFASWFFDSSSTQTGLMQDLEPMDPLPNHPQSFCGCIKWIGVVEKQWFGCHADWTPGFWPQNDILQADFLTSSSSQTSLMQDL
jgi:hypothetical protein